MLLDEKARRARRFAPPPSVTPNQKCSEWGCITSLTLGRRPCETVCEAAAASSKQSRPAPQPMMSPVDWARRMQPPALEEAFRRGRRAGARDALGRALLEILRGDHKKSSSDVLVALRKSQIVEAVVAHPSKGNIVRWRGPDNKKPHRTTWRSIRDSRLPKLRRQAKDDPTGP